MKNRPVDEALAARRTIRKEADSAPAGEGGAAFEDSIRRLGEIVEALEAGDLPLEQSLKLFEEGVRLAQASQATLDRAEKRVEELLGFDDDGNPIVREVETAEPE